MQTHRHTHRAPAQSVSLGTLCRGVAVAALWGCVELLALARSRLRRLR